MAMPLISRAIFQLVQWAARKGLRDDHDRQTARRSCTAQRFLAERHVSNRPCRFDVLAIDNHPGHSPAVRLHKDAFSPQL